MAAETLGEATTLAGSDHHVVRWCINLTKFAGWRARCLLYEDTVCSVNELRILSVAHHLLLFFPFSFRRSKVELR